MTVDSAHAEALVTYRRQGYVGVITLNRPDRRNALDLAVWEALNEAISAASIDEDARVVVLRGAGKSFCAGLDLSPDNKVIPLITAAPSASQKMEFYKVVRQIQGIHTRLERLSLPTIAAIHGHCLGAGLELVLCCDMRLCSEETVFALPEARLAIITDVGGLQRLPRVVGPGHAREIAFRGANFTAEHAKRINLVNEVYADKEALVQQAIHMAEEIAANPPLAVQGAKDVFLFSDNAPLEEALDYTAARSAMIMPSEDIFEAMSAYAAKRQGAFKGA
jgi:enoyl-CoA hydratase